MRPATWLPWLMPVLASPLERSRKMVIPAPAPATVGLALVNVALAAVAVA